MNMYYLVAQSLSSLHTYFDLVLKVHIIEVRDLKPADPNGSADPVIFVECLGQKKNTVVKQDQTSCVFDDIMFFNFKDLQTEDLQAALVSVHVYDADGPQALAKSMPQRDEEG